MSSNLLQLPVQYVIGILNILTDVALAGIPVFMLRHVHMPLEKRLRIEAAFAVRLLYVSCSCSRVYTTDSMAVEACQ
jgi:hypothetical protein